MPPSARAQHRSGTAPSTRSPSRGASPGRVTRLSCRRRLNHGDRIAREFVFRRQWARAAERFEETDGLVGEDAVQESERMRVLLLQPFRIREYALLGLERL